MALAGRETEYHETSFPAMTPASSALKPPGTVRSSMSTVSSPALLPALRPPPFAGIVSAVAPPPRRRGLTAGAPRRLDARQHSAGTPAAGVAKAEPETREQNPRQESPARRLKRVMTSEGLQGRMGRTCSYHQNKKRPKVLCTNFTTS